MAQVGETITYAQGKSSEDVSAVDTAVVEYCYAGGGFNGNTTNGGNGGAVEGAEIDVSGQDTLYIWVDERYSGGTGLVATGSYSSEISFSDTNNSDSSDEPFLIGAGGGGSGWDLDASSIFGDVTGSSGGARGGVGSGPDGFDAGGVAPPLGGDGAPDSSSAGGDGGGAIDDQNRGLVNGGTTITGGGAPPETAGEVQITYESDVSAPTITGTLSSSVSGDDITLDLPPVDWGGEQGSYLLHKREDEGSLSQFDSIDSTNSSYTDADLEDGERFYYRVRATNSAGDSSLSNEVNETAAVPAPTIGSPSVSDGDVIVPWTNNDNSPDGAVDVERSNDGGSTWSTIASDLPPSTAGVTDTETDSGTTYDYRVERLTDHATATSGTASITTPFRRTVTGASPGGDGSVTRKATAARQTTGAGSSDGVVTRATTAIRGATGEGSRGAGSLSRMLDALRSTIATGSSDGVITRTATMVRALTGESAGGDAFSTRSLSASRTVTGTGQQGTGTVTRAATMVRTLTGVGARGDGTATQLIATAWTLPQAPGDSGPRLLLSPSTVESDYDQIEFEATVTTDKLDRLSWYRATGDVQRETTAFGAWRRISRSGRQPVTITPPSTLSPPFDDRSVFVEGFSADEVAPNRYDVSIAFGLEQPRARSPLQSISDPRTVDTEAVALDPGETATVTLSWAPGADDLGEWAVTASSPQSSDSAPVSVTDAPWTLAFPAGTISLTTQQVGQIEREFRSGVELTTIPLRLTRSQLATLFAVGSRITAGRTRPVPDAPNVVVDTLPDDELSIDVDAPTMADVDSGSFILWSWSASLERPGELGFDVDVELIQQ